MLKENLAMLRNLNGYSQEKIAEIIGISRQAYAKWETGATVPDIEKCKKLADTYGITVDNLIKNGNVENVGQVPPPPAGKNIWGSVTVNERGQIVIPKAVRDIFGIVPGSRLIVLSDEKGIALMCAEDFEAHLREAMERAGHSAE